MQTFVGNLYRPVEKWYLKDLVKLVKVICRTVYTSNVHIRQFFIRKAGMPEIEVHLP